MITPCMDFQKILLHFSEEIKRIPLDLPPLQFLQLLRVVLRRLQLSEGPDNHAVLDQVGGTHHAHGGLSIKEMVLDA